MAITFVNFSGSAFTGATSSTTAMPAAIQANDVIVSHFYTQSADIHSSLAVGGTGWHLLGAVYGNGTTYAVAYCVANGSGQGGPQWSWTGAATGGANTNAFRGVYTSGATPLGVNFDITTGSGTTGALPSINTTSANGNVYYTLMTFTSQTVPTPSGYSADVIYTGSLPDVTEARKTVATPGASGGISVSLTSTTWVGALIELLGAAPPTTESGTIAQTLKLVTQSVAGAMWAKGTVAQTLKTITQALNGAEWARGAITQTLGNISEHVTAFEAEMWGTVTQTLGRATQVAHGWAEIIGTAVQTLGSVTQSLAGMFLEGVAGTITQTLGIITQSLTGLQSFVGTIVQTLNRATQSVLGAEWAHGAIVQTLKQVTQSLIGTFTTTLIAGHIAQTLKLISQNVSAHWSALEIGGIIQTLIHPIQQAASGWTTIFGTVVQTLPRMQTAIYAAELTLTTLYYATLSQVNAAIAAIEKQIRTTWHGPPDDPLPPIL